MATRSGERNRGPRKGFSVPNQGGIAARTASAAATAVRKRQTGRPSTGASNRKERGDTRGPVRRAAAPPSPQGGAIDRIPGALPGQRGPDFEPSENAPVGLIPDLVRFAKEGAQQQRADVEATMARERGEEVGSVPGAVPGVEPPGQVAPEEGEAGAEAKLGAREGGGQELRQQAQAIGEFQMVAPGGQVPGEPGRQSKAVFRVQRSMGSRELFNEAPSGVIQTPDAVFEKDEEGNLKVRNLTEEGKRKMSVKRQARLKEMGKFLGQDDPNAPKPPFRPGVPNFNPFTGQFTGIDKENSIFEEL
jgi:hypothetical protein